MPKNMIELATITDQEYTNVGSRCKAGTKRRKAGLQIETCPVVVPQAYIADVSSRCRNKKESSLAKGP